MTLDELAAKELEEVRELLRDVFMQATCRKTVEGKWVYNNHYLSAYEHAQGYLIKHGLIEEKDCEYR